MPPEVFLFKMPQGINSQKLVTHDLMASSLSGLMDPFLVVSLFEMRGPAFPPHPHAVFSVATYIFPESDIGFGIRTVWETATGSRPGRSILRSPALGGA